MRLKVLLLGLTVVSLTRGTAGAANLLQNGGFESMNGWDCWNIHCTLSSTHHSGQHGVLASQRNHYYEGPSQMIHVTAGSGWIKLLPNSGGHGGQKVELEIDFTFQDGSHQYLKVASHTDATVNDWIHLVGNFTAPNQSPSPGWQFVADDASVTAMSDVIQTGNNSQSQGTSSSNSVIDQIRKSDIHIHVTAASNINKTDVRIHVLQKKKSFPFGTAVNAWRYNANAANGKHRDFIHKHFNWAVHEASLKWPQVEPHRGQNRFDVPLATLNGLRNHNIKVRGHNLVWSVPQYVQDWVKALSGNELRTAVKDHITETMQRTHGLLEHWDVNNENLHGHWYQDRLHDPNYDIELFREAHNVDSHVKLFLNDYNVVANSGSTSAYLQQANCIKAANVGLYRLGAQCHFGNEEMPDPDGIKQRLDTLALSGLPIWVTELDVMIQDENKRADAYEKALRAFCGHPAVEGIMFWGFWDQLHWRGEKAALVKGDNLQLTAAGHRVLDLLENQWMTDDSRLLSQTGNQYTVRGFCGDYEVHVIFKGQELSNLKKSFHLGATAHTVNINVHT